MDSPYKNEIIPVAEKIISGERYEKYGHAQVNFNNIAAGWSVIFGVPISARQVALANIWTKVCRDTNSAQVDNLVDIVGYAALADEVE